MDRLLARPQRLLLGLFLALLIVGQTGCSFIATGLWAINPNDRPAQFKELKEKRVVVVCRQNNALEFRNGGVAKQISQQVANKLKERVKKIETVRQSEIDDWLDNNELVSFAELGKAMEADKVVAIELEHFSTFRDTTLFQGEATVEVSVHDVVTGDVEFTRVPLESLYPQANPIARDASVSESKFRHTFVEVLSDQIARTFYAYDSREANVRDVYFAH